jgi:hypothetical protein
LAKGDYGKIENYLTGPMMKFGLKTWSLFQSLTGSTFVTLEKTYFQSFRYVMPARTPGPNVSFKNIDILVAG